MIGLVILQFLLTALNVVVAIKAKNKYSWINWFAAGFCACAGLAILIQM
jgi:hypothetical protein